MAHHHDQGLTPGYDFINIVTGVLFCLSIVFHKISVQYAALSVYFGLSYLQLYDLFYKTLATISVFMVITINTPKFILEINRRKKQIQSLWKRKRK